MQPRQRYADEIVAGAATRVRCDAGGVSEELAADRRRAPSSARSSALIAAGILLSRILGLVRQKLIAHYLGADLGGRGVQRRVPQSRTSCRICSAKACSRRRSSPCTRARSSAATSEEADRIAGAVGAILALVVSVIVAVGVLAAPLFVELIAGGFEGQQLELAILLDAHPLPGRRPVRDGGVVPRHSQQPPPLLPVVRRAGRVERGHDRRAPRVRPSRRGRWSSR